MGGAVTIRGRFLIGPPVLGIGQPLSRSCVPANALWWASMTVENFKRRLRVFPDDWEIDFSGKTDILPPEGSGDRLQSKWNSQSTLNSCTNPGNGQHRPDTEDQTAGGLTAAVIRAAGSSRRTGCSASGLRARSCGHRAWRNQKKTGGIPGSLCRDQIRLRRGAWEKEFNCRQQSTSRRAVMILVSL